MFFWFPLIFLCLFGFPGRFKALVSCKPVFMAVAWLYADGLSGGIREPFEGVLRCLGGSSLVISTPKMLRRTITNHDILFQNHFLPLKRPYSQTLWGQSSEAIN